ncbi:hypothetical protein [Pelagibacterium halotolerans]|uniref:hypothetical protein n=1 Tax=Pelagibacterium halotolerans TaxID=531813 RepID=UPI00384AA349
MTMSSCPSLPERFAGLGGTLDTLAREAVAGITVDPARIDPTFGRFGALAGFARAAVTVEGALLEAGLRAVLEADGAFTLMPADFRLPLVEAALAAARSNNRDRLSAIRIDPRAYAPEHYKPDIIAVHDSGTAHVLELKRTTLSYGKALLGRVEDKLVAAGLVLRDVLHADRRQVLVRAVNVALVDCDGSDTRDLVIGLGEIDGLLGCAGAAQGMAYLRHRFSAHVQAAFADLVEAGHRPGGQDERKPCGPDAIAAEPDAYPETPSLAETPVAIRFARKTAQRAARA